VVITHLADTGWLIRSLRKNPAYTATLRKIGAPQLAVSLISVAELLEGVYLADDRARIGEGSLASVPGNPRTDLADL
jgi:predicted nucleic acid-binding protein